MNGLVRRSPRQELARAYRGRAVLDEIIERLEAQVQLLREQNGNRLPREHIQHGDESAYRRHIRRGIPFPEDLGRDPCGCRLAHSREESRRKRLLSAARRHDDVEEAYADGA